MKGGDVWQMADDPLHKDKVDPKLHDFVTG